MPRSGAVEVAVRELKATAPSTRAKRLQTAGLEVTDVEAAMPTNSG